jgi:hypothetical protein
MVGFSRRGVGRELTILPDQKWIINDQAKESTVPTHTYVGNKMCRNLNELKEVESPPVLGRGRSSEGRKERNGLAMLFSVAI